MKIEQKTRTRELVEVSLFVAIIVALWAIPFLGYIPLGFTRATTIHIPVIIGSILLGPKKGALLGFVFGLTSLWTNTFSPTLTSFTFSPFYSVGDVSGNFFSLIICFVPRILVGVVPYYVYQLMSKLSKKAQSLSLAVAGVAGSLTNTLLVMNMIYLFFSKPYAAAKNVSVDALYGLILSIIGINGVPEAIAAGVISAAVCKVLMKAHVRKENE
jgi:uncharacterized membrane protein